jgi:polyisoprenoid-binding protein YceI
MKSFFVAVGLVLCGWPALSQSGTILIADVTASSLRWTGHAAVGAYAPTGKLQLQSATLTTAADGRTPRTAKVVVAMTTLKAENTDLGEHLRKADFFDVAHYPTATFELTDFRADFATGRLTIKGITKLVRLPVKIETTANGCLLRGTARIDRTAFGIIYNSPGFFSSLGDQAVGDIFEVAFAVQMRPQRQRK